MNGRFAVVMNMASVKGQVVFVLWQRSHGDPYLFETRHDARRVFVEMCKEHGFKGPLGEFQYWIVDFADESACVYGTEATLKLI